MTHTAYVIPVDPAEPGRTFEFENDAELYAQLHGALGAEVLGKTPHLPTPDGPVRMWVDDTGFLGAASFNPRASYIAECSHYLTPIIGTVAITGPYSPGSESWQGLTIGHLEGLADFMADAHRIYERLARRERVEAVAMRMREAIGRRDRDEVRRLLDEFRAISPAALAAGQLALVLTAPELYPGP